MTNAINELTVASTHQRANMIRDVIAAVLVMLGVLLPWNIYFGIGISGSAGGVLVVLVLAALLSLSALVLSHLGPYSIRLPDADPARINRLRRWLNVPYLVVVVGFLMFALAESISTGGSSAVPPGIGPGAWLGVAGALLAAQPVITEAVDDARYGLRTCRFIGICSLVLAMMAVAFTLYWRTRFVLPNIGEPDVGMPNLVVAVTALLYAVVTVLPVAIAARWIISFQRAGRLASVLLAGAVLIAGLVVWTFPVGRDLDAFHGIAQSTSTAGVGFEGYLAWAAVAAIVGTATLRGALSGEAVADWQAAARKCLLLIAVWCGGRALLQIADLMMTSVLDLPAPPYNGTTLMAFDLVVSVLALWLYVNSSGRAAAPRTVLTLLYGILAVLTVCRVILGVALVPRVPPLNPAEITDVYGNTLAQQITSTFDVALCVLGFALLVIAFITGNGVTRKQSRRTSATAASAPSDADAQTYQSVPTTVMPAPVAASAPATVKIFRPEPVPQESYPADRVADVLAQSTQRFAAGTTYGGGPASPSAPHNAEQ